MEMWRDANQRVGYSHQKEEWRLPCGVTGPVVVRKLRHWQISSPIMLFVIRYEA